MDSDVTPAVRVSRRWLGVAALALALLPVVSEAVAKVFIVARPYWVHYYDPETIFFYDGVRLARGAAPFNVDHPGAPTQFLSAMLVLLAGDDPLEIDGFRRAGYLLAMIGVVLGAVVLHRAILRHLHPLLEMTALWVWFSFPTVLRWTGVWTTEALYLPFGALAIAAALRFDADRTSANAVFLGVCLGVLVSLKFLFAAWLPAGVVLALVGGDLSWPSRLKHAGVLLLSAVSGFFVLTLPSVPRYPYMAAWFWKLASRTGEYGSGSQSFLSISQGLSRVVDWSLTAKGWYALFAVGILALVIATVRSRRDERKWDGAALFALTAFAFSSLAVFRANDNGRYMLPSGLAALMVFSLALARWPAWGRLRWAVGTATLAGCLLTRALAQDYESERAWAGHGPRLRNCVERILIASGVSLEQSVIVYSFRFPDPAFALRIMTSNEGDLRRVEERFPRTGHYNPWTRELHLPGLLDHWDALVIAEQDVAGIPFAIGRVLGRADGYVVLAPELGLKTSSRGIQ